jgi:hypothetical protein
VSEPIWNKFLTERDKQVFCGRRLRRACRIRPEAGACRHRCELRLLRDKPEPILDSIKRWRNSCGEESWVAIALIKKLIDKAHQKGLPVIYTTGVRRADNWDSGGWRAKNTRSAEAPKTPSNRDGYQIVDEIAPSPKDLVIYKQKPSASSARR